MVLKLKILLNSYADIFIGRYYSQYLVFLTLLLWTGPVDLIYFIQNWEERAH